jgi:hypothetical protein
VAEVRRTPCEACPYRRDVPRRLERRRVREAAPPARLCHGWAVVSGQDSLALRIAGAPEIPEAAVPLFATHGEAADHGQRAIERPPGEAVELVARLRRKHRRLR